MKGWVGLVSSAIILNYENEWTDENPAYRRVVDVSPDGPLAFCLPLFVRSIGANSDLPETIVECLLLQQVSPDTQGYTRAGLLKTSLTLAHALPEDLRWIVDFAESELSLGDEATVTLY